MKPRLRRRAREIQYRRDEIDLLHRRRDPARATLTWQLQDEGNVRRRIVEKEPVFLFAVIAESFAMVREQHDRGALVEVERAQAIEQPADDLVGIRNLAVIRLVRREARRRRVRLVRLVDVEEEEERFLRL